MHFDFLDFALLSYSKVSFNIHMFCLMRSFLMCFFVKTIITERKLAEFSKKASVKPKPLSVLRSLEEKYVVVMKKLQFGKFNINFL